MILIFVIAISIIIVTIVVIIIIIITAIVAYTYIYIYMYFLLILSYEYACGLVVATLDRQTEQAQTEPASGAMGRHGASRERPAPGYHKTP